MLLDRRQDHCSEKEVGTHAVSEGGNTQLIVGGLDCNNIKTKQAENEVCGNDDCPKGF